MLDFQPITLGIKELVESYTFKYCEGSCQHSFVSSWCLQRKYGDMFCEHNGFLYTLRSRRCTSHERVYLFPHGDRSNPEALRNAVQNILDDAHEHDSRVKFETLTLSAKNIVCSLFPGRFSFNENRDYFEYVYRTNKLAEFSGSDLSRIRQYANQFERNHKGSYRTEMITPSLIPQVWELACMWHKTKRAENADNPVYIQQIDSENEAIKIGLDSFSELGLSGTAVFIGDEMIGFTYGAPLSDECFDLLAEKGITTKEHIYCVLLRDFTRMSCKNYKRLNFEEDIGVQGLRTMKIRYKPEFIMEKFTAVESV